MGALFKFECESCKYSAEVSGGPDCGMMIDSETNTMVCNECKNLVDVNTYDGPEIIDGMIQLIKIDINNPEEILDKEPLYCPKCHSTNLTAWSEDIGCPKCGKKMIRGDLTVLWD